MSASSPSDEVLVAAVAAGSEAALGMLYDRYADSIYAHARRLLGDLEAAEDIVQETFLALWNRAETFDPRLGSAGGWLRSIGRHRSVDRLRTLARGPRLVAFSQLGFDDDDSPDSLDQALADGQPAGSGAAEVGPETAALDAETRRLIGEALQLLPDHERMVIELAYRDGLSQSEIAARVGWPLGTVKTRTRRALRQLRDALAEGTEVGVSALAGSDDGAR